MTAANLLTKKVKEATEEEKRELAKAIEKAKTKRIMKNLTKVDLKKRMERLRQCLIGSIRVENLSKQEVLLLNMN
eukprot:UN03711